MKKDNIKSCLDNKQNDHDSIEVIIKASDKLPAVKGDNKQALADFLSDDGGY